jgi:hypothetical protein
VPQTPGVPDHAAPAPTWVARSRKAIAAGCGVVAQAVAAGLLHGDVKDIAVGLLALATVIGVYQVPNAPGP